MVHCPSTCLSLETFVCFEYDDQWYKRGLQIKESYKRDITVVQSTRGVIHHFEMDPLSTVSWTVGRLGGREEVVRGETDN